MMYTEEEKLYTQKEVLIRMSDFRKDNFSPSWNKLAEEIGITYSYLVDWKNHKARLGQNSLNRIVEFLEEQGY